MTNIRMRELSEESKVVDGDLLERFLEFPDSLQEIVAQGDGKTVPNSGLSVNQVKDIVSYLLQAF